jgi:CzcA family heavy metal efflux pump
MLNSVIKTALRHRPLVVVLALVVLVYGAYAAATLPIDVFPDLDRPRVTVVTECPGLAPEEVETLVTFPLESALLGASGVEDVRTQSGPELSSVRVEFGWGTDVRAARQVVQERLATAAGDLPPNVRPQMAPTSSLMGVFLVSGLRRQAGPNGGDLIPVPNTPYYAERVPGAAGAPPKLLAWKPTDRRDPAAWVPVETAAVAWSPRPDADGARGVGATIAGVRHDLTFPSEFQRQLALRTLADWVVRPRVMKVKGVAQVVAMGGGRKQYQILVDPARLNEFGVSLQEVEAALRDNNVNFTGGYSVQNGVEKPIRIIGRLGPRPEQTVRDLRDIPVKPGAKRVVALGDVARVTEGEQQKRGDASVNGFPGVSLTITKQPHTDTRELTNAVRAALREIEPSLPADVVIEPGLYEVREFIDRGVSNVAEALAIGAGLVLIVLFLFLLNFRTTFISLTAIPLSLAVTAIVFQLIGALTGTALSINVMTLGGLAVAMGELVDDAIVDVENIFRRLRENRLAGQPKSSLRVVYEASAEVRGAIVFGTVVVILVFLPLFALSGIEGRMFTPLAIAYIVSILASLAVSLTVTPVLSYYLLAHSRAVHREKDAFLVRGLKWVAARVVRFSMRRAILLLALTWLLVAYFGWRVTTIGADFLPQFDEGSVQVNVTLPAGTALDASNQAAGLADAALQKFKKSPENPNGEILRVVRRSGRAELDEHADPPNVTEFIVAINPASGKPRAEVLKLLHDEVKAAVPGADVEVEQPLAHLMSHMLSGSTAQIAIQVYGDDMDTLVKLASQIKTAATGIPGVASLAIEPIRQIDEVHIRLRPDRLKEYGVSREYVGHTVQTALHGATVSQVVEGQRRFDLVLRLEEPYRRDLANLGELRIDLPDLPEPSGHDEPGPPAPKKPRQARLKDLAYITPPVGGDTGPNQVKRDNARRRIVVKCNAAGRDLASVVADIRAAVKAKVSIPEGYHVEYAGQFESQRRATRIIVGLAAASVVGMFFVLYMLFPSTRVVLQILHAIPVAFIGGVLALVLTNQTLTVASLVGFISLGGIAVRNGVLLVTHYVHLMRHEGEGFTEKMVVRGSLERLSPVLMTALTAGIGLLPLVLAGNQPGREILYPVATVIFGGLITSTLCEFLLHPGLFWRFSGRDGERLAKTSDGSDGLDDLEAAPTAHAAPDGE